MRGTEITDVAARAFTVPTDVPEADGTAAWSETTVVVVTASAAGRTGVGWTYGPAAVADLVGDQLAGAVVGRDACAVTGCWVDMVRAVRNATRAGLAGYAVSAVDVALWDLKARLLDVSLVDLLGAVRTDVPVYGSGGFTTYDDDQLVAQLTGWARELAIPRVKIKIGESWGTDVERDVARVQTARAAVGPEVELYVDANGGYRRKQAVRVARRLAAADVTWFEEPVSSDDLGGLREVRDAVDADVTAGEYGTDVAYFARMVAAGAVDCLQVDATRCGGYTEWLRVAAVAAAHGLDVSAHCAPHLHAPVAAATPNLRHVEWFHDHVQVERRLLGGSLDPTGGTVSPPRHTAGGGWELDPGATDRGGQPSAG